MTTCKWVARLLLFILLCGSLFFVVWEMVDYRSADCVASAVIASLPTVACNVGVWIITANWSDDA